MSIKKSITAIYYLIFVLWEIPERTSVAHRILRMGTIGKIEKEWKKHERN